VIGTFRTASGRKPMLLISQVGTFIGFIVMARAAALWMLYVRASRRRDGGQPVARSGVHLGSHRAEPAGEVVRADRIAFGIGSSSGRRSPDISRRSTA
jgi:hypothetical protein